MMFEKLIERAAAAAERRARVRTFEMAERAELPPGIRAEAAPGGVRLIGRALRRRFLLEPALRWMPFDFAQDRRLR